MKKAILIAEKPSYMRDIQNCYNRHKSDINYDIDFIAQVGHTVQLMEPSEINEMYKSWDINLLPIEPENEGGWKYKVIPGMEDVYKNIKKHIKSGKYDVVIHAGDPDQEGELLTRLVLKFVGNDLPVLRLFPNSTTDTDIFKALQNMKSDSDPLYEHLYAAAIVRQHTDYRFGMNGSRAAAAKILTSKDNKIAVGRCMSAILNMIVTREKEIADFVPKTSYGINAVIKDEIEGQYFREILSYDEESKEEKYVDEIIFYNEKKDAKEKINTLHNHGIVEKILKKKVTTYAPKLYDIGALQVDASKKGYSADVTKEIVQSLYEKHFLTYPRTDCKVLSSSDCFYEMLDSTKCIEEFKDLAEKAKDKVSKIKGMSKYVNDKELQKHGHSALVPTDTMPNFASLNEDEQIIYKMVCKRFLAIFQPPLIEEKTKVILNVDGDKFVINGKVIVDKGYTKFLDINVQETVLPEFKENETININSYKITEKTTTCPKRFTDGTLIDAMISPAKYLNDKSIKENFSIGTSATRDELIKKLIKNKYIKRQKGYLIPTEWGTFLTNALKNIDITKVDMTAKWEGILSQIRNGEISIEQAEDVMKKEVRRMIKDIVEMEQYQFGNVNINRKIIGKCPRCGKDLIQGEKNYFCSGYKEGCKSSVPVVFLDAHFTPEDVNLLLEGNEIEKKLKKNGKSWNQKLKYDFEEGKMSFIKKEVVEVSTDIECPYCHQDRLTKAGNKYYCDCGFNIRNLVAGRELSENELLYIFSNGKSTKLDGFISKKGKKFKAKLILKDGKDSGFDFDFN